MANFRTTVIMKTDMVDSTPRIARLSQSEMGLQRKQHKRFIEDITIRNLGSIYQEEGDGYWIEFPSVTSAVLAAREMHQGLKALQAGTSERERITVRIAIAVGDILHQEQDLIGTAMNLTARIEKITPPGEIYLSQAAWLVLNRAEIPTSFVNEYKLKGFRDLEKIYKVEQKLKTLILADQYIVFADVQGFTAYTKSHTVEEVEQFLTEYDDFMHEICDAYGGVVRQVIGDEYFLTFLEANQMLKAMEKLCQYWKSVLERHKTGIAIGIHKGKVNIYRSYIFSEDINVVYVLHILNEIVRSKKGQISVVTSGVIRNEMQATSWEPRFQELDQSKITNDLHKSVLEEHSAYQLFLGDWGEKE